ncbi:MAG: cistern family PEP-CTERM protein [Acidobacteria bacterium]|nr:cistern family PEP-CTERM protein [Acidobacteriota bacterium]
MWVGLLAATAALAPGAHAATYTVFGNLDSNNVAEFTFADIPFSNVDATGFTVAFTVKNASPLFDPTITAIALTVPTAVTGFNAAASTIPANWDTYFEIGGVNTPQPLGMFDFCAESGNGDKNCGGGNPNDGIAKGASFAFSLRFLGDFDGVTLSSIDFVPLAARFQETGEDGSGSDVAICRNGNCDESDMPDVPEPSTMLLMGGALLGLGLLKKKRIS